MNSSPVHIGRNDILAVELAVAAHHNKMAAGLVSDKKTAAVVAGGAADNNQNRPNIWIAKIKIQCLHFQWLLHFLKNVHSILPSDLVLHYYNSQMLASC